MTLEKRARARKERRGRAPLGALIALIALIMSLAPQPLSAETPDAPMTPEARILVQRVHDYLQSLRHLQGRFFQINADGSRAEGVFYIRRPWRMRFEYAAPRPLLVIADGTWLIIQESPSRPADRYPLTATPVRFLLAPELDLERAARVVSAREEEGRLILHLASRIKDAPGELTLYFQEKPFALASWTAVDPQGLRTRVTLSRVKEGVKARNSLFRVLEKDPFSRGR